MSKFHKLRAFLEGRGDSVPMSFADIERILGFKLPKSQAYAASWSNNPSNNVMTREWLAAGYKTEQVDLAGRKLVFRRAKPTRLPRGARPAPDAATARPSKRHPLFGALKGLATIMPH